MTLLAEYEYLAISLFDQPLEAVWAAATRTVWGRSGSKRYRAESGVLDCARVYSGRPPPGGAHQVRAVFFEPASSADTTAMLANLEDGWLTLGNLIAQQLSGQHIYLRTSEDREFPLSDFKVWCDGKSVRTVRASRDERGWEFYAEGALRVFEDPALYRRHRIRDRLNRKILTEYARRLGWDISMPEFWKTSIPAHYLFENLSARPAPVEE